LLMADGHVAVATPYPHLRIGPLPFPSSWRLFVV
jgi:hypothetical protein